MKKLRIWYFIFRKINIYEKHIAEKIKLIFFKHVVLIQKAFRYVLKLTLLRLPTTIMLRTCLKV